MTQPESTVEWNDPDRLTVLLDHLRMVAFLIGWALAIILAAYVLGGPK